MTRADLITEVRRRVGEDTADFWTSDDIIKALDFGVRKFAREYDWSWLQTYSTQAILSGANTLTLPDDIDVNRIAAIRVTMTGQKGQPLKKVTIADGLKLRDRYTTAGTPKWYYLENSTLSGAAVQAVPRIVPAAQSGGTVELVYYRRPAALTADGQEPDIPEDYHEAIAAHAAAKLWLHEQETGISQVKAGEQISIYQDILEDALNDEQGLGQDEQVAWGMEDDERERSGIDSIFRLPDNYEQVGWF